MQQLTHGTHLPDGSESLLKKLHQSTCPNQLLAFSWIFISPHYSLKNLIKFIRVTSWAILIDDDDDDDDDTDDDDDDDNNYGNDNNTNNTNNTNNNNNNNNNSLS